MWLTWLSFTRVIKRDIAAISLHVSVDLSSDSGRLFSPGLFSFCVCLCLHVSLDLPSGVWLTRFTRLVLFCHYRSVNVVIMGQKYSIWSIRWMCLRVSIGLNLNNSNAGQTTLFTSIFGIILPFLWHIIRLF